MNVANAGQIEAKQKGTKEADGAAATTKSEIVYMALRTAILRGELQPGQRIDQHETASALNVSRMPLRQALLRLHADQLVLLEPHRTAIVAPLDLADLEDMYAMRIALEPMLAEVAIRRCGLDVPLEMSALNEAMIAANAAGDSLAYVDLDRKFHRTLYAAAGYRRAMLTLDQLRDASDRYVVCFASEPERVERSIGEHIEMIEAVKAGASRDGARLVLQHVSQGRDTLMELVGGFTRTTTPV